MYLKRTYNAGATIAVHKTFSRKHDPGIKREKGEGSTPDAVAKHNRKMAERELAWVLENNFKGGKDAHIVFTYPIKNRPGVEQAKKDFRKAKSELRKGAKERGMELKFASALGVGQKGGIHLHMVTNCTDLELLRQAWPHGGIHITPLYLNGDFAGLGKYFVGQAKESENQEALPGKERPAPVEIIGRWSCSRNLVRRPPEEEEIDAFCWREPPQPVKGYIVDVDSIDAGENPVTGLPYLFYRMIRIPETSKAKYQATREDNRQALAEWKNNQSGKLIKPKKGRCKDGP